MNIWINMILYQATWLTSVAGAGHGLWWPGLVALAAFAALQLGLGPWRHADACLIAGVSVLGFVIDSTFVQMGLMQFEAPVPWPALAPLWMVALWTSFALTLNHSLAFLQTRPLLAALLGGVGAPMAYWAASRGWHALSFPLGVPLMFGTTALAWALLMPLLARAALRLRVLDAAPAHSMTQAKP
ncbi:MAG TPA: DUF2878 domain-containing protein [Rudaea sp.]|nr:DUF2878 domain-containing protein [Rudaea sp.]